LWSITVNDNNNNSNNNNSNQLFVVVEAVYVVIVTGYVVIATVRVVIATVFSMSQDAEAWMRLSERVSQQCHMIGDVTYHRPSLLKYEPLARVFKFFKSSAIVLRAEHVTSVSDLVDVTVKMRDQCCEINRKS
jgi:hypothetical protein